MKTLQKIFQPFFSEGGQPRTAFIKSLQGFAHSIPLYSKRCFSRHSFSQCGEDMVLHYYLSKIQKGFYVDVGARHPFLISNTAFFYQRGWRGINIEADPSLMPPFHRSRKRDINLNLAVGNPAPSLDFFVFYNPEFNTFDPEIARKRQQKGAKVEKVLRIQVEPLADILDRHLPPGQTIDFMSVDVEGFDLQVLQTNNWDKYAPRFLLVETLGVGSFKDLETNETHLFLGRHDYTLVDKAGLTCIYRKATQTVS